MDLIISFLILNFNFKSNIIHQLIKTQLLMPSVASKYTIGAQEGKGFQNLW